MKRIVLLVSLIVTPSAVMLAQTTNSWIDGNGKWETSTNWSHATAPSISDAADLITNAGNKTVTIDGTTSGSFPATLTISNLTISSLATNTLLLNNAGTITPLRILNNLSITSGGALVITNSTLLLNGLSGGGFGDDGAVSLNSGSLIITNAPTVVGSVGRGSFINSGGTLLTLDVFVGSRTGAGGTAVFAAGTNTVSGFLDLGNYPASTGTVLVTGGRLVVTNGIHVGDGGVGQMTVSNGTVQGQQIYVGHLGGSQGTLTMAGGTNTLSSFLEIGGNSNGTGTVWVTGGQLVVTNDVTYVGNSGVGQLTISSGTVLANLVHVGNAAGSQGTLTIAGGSLTVTNDAHDAMTEVRYGTLTLITGGVFVTDSLLITNASGSFINNGGIFSITGQAQVDQGTQTVASGTTQVSSNFVVGSTANSTGTVNITGGQLIATNGVVGIGNNGTITGGGGVGRLTVSNGTLLATTILLGSSTTNRSDLILAAGGTILSSGTTNCLFVDNSLGTENLGNFDWYNGSLQVGVTGPADYDIAANATFASIDAFVGYSDVGTLTMAGGVANISSRLIVGYIGPPLSTTCTATGTVWITGGQVTVDGYSIIGDSGVGQMTISNGTVTAGDVFVATSSNPGTLTLAGGTLTLNSLQVTNSGRFIFSAGGLGSYATTNSNGQPFVVGDGSSAATYRLLGGAHSFDNSLRIRTNAVLSGCGTISGTVVVDAGAAVVADCGGTLTFTGSVTNNGIMHAQNGSVLESYGPVVNNGIIDMMSGKTNFHSGYCGSGTVVDSSCFRVTGLTKQGNDINLTWTTVGGRSYVVQTNTPPAKGSYINSFIDLSPVISIPGTSLGKSNYIDLGGATNAPTRFYRVRLVP